MAQLMEYSLFNAGLQEIGIGSVVIKLRAEPVD
jgi:hypothetical protein